ncbi:hypothetical protein L8956_04390 [Peribacillus frigoritolerans]|uniref:hypothetical protein n=1 Tax=Peribacillus frigoritolerans TaxID=450367 RepID=UPI001EFE4C86|nr:hypothetical protein [Peribacillus frigoritolerans]ULM97971.1 hypothetical protein L8956_04390 [Peribacillus frigoritolerans]
MTVDRAGIRAFIEIPEDSWHLFPLFFMALTMELNHRFAAFTIEPKSVNKSIMKLAGQYNELFFEFKMHRNDNEKKHVRFCVSRVFAPNSRVKASNSRVFAPNSRVFAPNSRVFAPNSRVFAPNSRVKTSNSRVKASN